MSSYNHWSFCSKHNYAHHAQTHSVTSSSRASPLVLCSSKQVDKRGRVRRKRSWIFYFILCFFSQTVSKLSNLLHRHTFVTRSVFRKFGTWAEISMNHIPDIKIKIIYHWTEQVTHTYLSRLLPQTKDTKPFWYQTELPTHYTHDSHVWNQKTRVKSVSDSGGCW